MRRNSLGSPSPSNKELTKETVRTNRMFDEYHRSAVVTMSSTDNIKSNVNLLDYRKRNEINELINRSEMNNEKCDGFCQPAASRTILGST